LAEAAGEERDGTGGGVLSIVKVKVFEVVPSLTTTE
jgi:hypothetical protein